VPPEKELGVKVKGDGKGHEPQGVADAQLRTALGLLQQARAELKGKPLTHVDKANRLRPLYESSSAPAAAIAGLRSCSADAVLLCNPHSSLLCLTIVLGGAGARSKRGALPQAGLIAGAE
jgi:hypothetical protein